MVIFHWHCHGDLTMKKCVSINQHVVDLSMEIADFFKKNFTKKNKYDVFFQVCLPSNFYMTVKTPRLKVAGLAFPKPDDFLPVSARVFWGSATLVHH
jgi:hypothetical protein